MHPLVSVIVPNYNHARYLPKRIDSVLSQTYENLELILLDDCSTDESRTVLEQYRMHPKVSALVYNEVNGGKTFPQWEKGISLAKGEYIWIAESDDFAEPSFLETIMRHVEAHPEISLAYTASHLVDEQDQVIGTAAREVVPNAEGVYLAEGKTDAVHHLFFKPIVPNASAVVFKKSSFSKVDKSYKDYRICGDWQFWADLFLEGKVLYIPICLNNFRQSTTSVSRSTQRKDNYKVFLMERLKVGMHLFEKTKREIPLSLRLRYIEMVLFDFLLEAGRKRIALNSSELATINQSIYRLTMFAPASFFVAVARVVIFVARKILRPLKNRVQKLAKQPTNPDTLRT